jgi:hypothetical protein
MIMASESKAVGCAFLTIRLGATQTFQVAADKNVNTLETDALYHGGSSEGTPVAVLVSVMTKLADAMSKGDTRVQLLIDENNQIVG